MDRPASPLAGGADLFRGIGMVAKRPGVAGLGLIPPAVTSVLLIVVLFGLQRVAHAAIHGEGPWGIAWLATSGEFVQVVVEIAIVSLGVFVAVLSFSALTLALGSPVYERIAVRIDDAVSVVPATDSGERPHQMVGRVIGQVLVTVLMSVAGGLVCFLLGLVPVVGAVVGPVASSVFGGWMMARELTGPALERRGRLRLRERAAVLRTQPLAVLAFGIPAFWLLAIPFVSILFFPGAVAGGTLLTRRLLGEATRPAGQERPIVTGG